MPFQLDDEKAIDVLIWWIEGSDGSIDYREEQAVERILENLDYSLETFYQETLMYLSGLSSEGLEEMVDRAIDWGSSHFSKERKQIVMLLLGNIAAVDGDISGSQQEKLDRVKTAFGVEGVEGKIAR